MIRVRTGSRLHFGLFSLPSEHAGPWLNQEGEPTIPRRQFGGVGLMIDGPGNELTVTRARVWSADGPLAERALRFARTYCESAEIADAFHLRVESAASEHAGLGTGTQLGLAIGRAIAELTNQPRDAVTLARLVGRGLRSALGVHGFERGGFLIEGGKIGDQGISPLLFRSDFPEDWHILLITPHELVGTHGPREVDAFAALAKLPPNKGATETLCRIVLLGMLPALAEGDFAAFGEAVYDFNHRVGSMFQLAQHGVYAQPRIEQLIKTIRDFGVKGVGQSSWGPTVFAFAGAEEIDALRDWLLANLGLAKEEMTMAAPRNRGALIA